MRTGGGGVRGREHKHTTPQANFKRLVNKNEIKPKIGGPTPLAIFPKSLDPHRDFCKNLSYLLCFQQVCIYDVMTFCLNQRWPVL
jgi:hypothetical protein